MELTESLRLHASDAVAARVVDDRAVLVSLDQRLLHQLNDVGTRVWSLLDGRTLGEIVQVVVQEYEVEPDVARADVMTFARTLLDLGVVVAEPAE